MPRRCALLALLLPTLLTGLAAPALAQDAPPASPDEKPTTSELMQAYEALSAKFKAMRPKPGGDVGGYVTKVKSLSADFVAEWGPKAATAPEHLIVARFCRTNSDHTRQLAHLDAALKLAGDDVKSAQLARWGRIYALKSLERYDEASQALEAFQSAHPDAPQKRYFSRLARSIGAAKARASLKGQPAPALGVEDVLGAESLSLAALKGKVVVLDFFATWCGPCRRVIPHLIGLQEKHGAQGLQVVAVTRMYGSGWLDGKSVKNLTPEAERKLNADFRTSLKINYPFAFSATASKAYHVTGIPQLVVIDRAGKVALIKVGAGDMTAVDETIAKLLAQKAGAADEQPADESSEESK